MITILITVVKLIISNYHKICQRVVQVIYCAPDGEPIAAVCRRQACRIKRKSVQMANFSRFCRCSGNNLSFFEELRSQDGSFIHTPRQMAFLSDGLCGLLYLATVARRTLGHISQTGRAYHKLSAADPLLLFVVVCQCALAGQDRRSIPGLPVEKE